MWGLGSLGMSDGWAAALAVVAERLNAAGIEWMLLGSAATALRGVAIVPGDIDIALRTAEDVARAAFVLPTPEVSESADWVSTTDRPALVFRDNGETWTFGRWFVDGVKVELANIDAPSVATLMLETRSPVVWPERERLTCRGHRIPTVPVEVQLATMVARGQVERIDATVAALSELRIDLLRRAISDRRAEGTTMEVPASLRSRL